MIAVMYLRKSRADRAEEPVEVTLLRHEEALTQVARAQGITVRRIYREVASGDRLEGRQEMKRLLHDCQEPDFEAVLCMDIDRLGRGSMAEQGYILDTLKGAGIRLITPRKTYDLNNDMDETYSEFESFIARQELKAIKRRLQRGVTQSAQRGNFVSAPPYGYARAMNARQPTLTPVAEEAEAVRLIFDWYTREQLGCQRIADRLNAMGYLPRRAARFSRTTVLDILENPVYIGRVVRRGSAAVDTAGIHPPIIGEDVFEKAQIIRARHAHPPTAARQLQNPLAGLVECARCGGKLQRLPAGGRRKTELLGCPQAGCMAAAPLRLVEAAILQALLPYLPAEIVPPAAMPATPDTAVREEQLKAQRARLYALLEEGVYTPEEFRERQQVLATQQTMLARPLLPPAPVTTATAAAYAAADAAARNAFLKAILRRVIYDKAPHTPPAAFSLTLELRDI